MSVYRNIEVDIPKERVTIEKQRDGKPALVKYTLEAPYDRKKGYACPKRTTIGHVCVGSSTKMHPTTQYADIFPNIWEQVSNESYKPKVRKIGMFTALQAINNRIGIKDILDRTYGTDKSNGIIDYVMYSIIHHTDNSSGFADKMKDELLFSREPYSDSWYSRLFESTMTKELELLFRKRWALRCKEEGVEDVWLCIDGSNDDCQSKGVELAEHGHAKSGKNINIVSFTYAVTEEGKPVTYDVYRGGLVDAKAMQMVIDFLNECGIGVKGVILDRGYCDSNALKYLSDLNIPYVIMVKGAPDGYSKMVEDNGEKIKMNMDYWIPRTSLFGYQEQVQLFKNYSHQDYLTLFFDLPNGSERVVTLLRNLSDKMDEVDECLSKGKNPKIEGKYSNLITICTKQEGDDVVKYADFNKSALQTIANEKGLYSIVTSEAMTPARVHQLYSCRNASETQYMLVKGQLGYGVTRVHYNQGVRAKFTVAFIASVVRYEIEQAAKTVKRNVNQIVLEMEKVEAQKINDVYTYSHTENERQTNFFRSLGANAKELIDAAVKFENDRLAGRTVTPRRRKPGPKKGSHRKVYDEQGNEIPRKPGVKPGTKRSDVNMDGTPRQKPGVKAGTKRSDVKKDGTPRKKPGVEPGTKRGMYNKDGSLRKKPGRKPKLATNEPN